jgi:hypothetical protein
MNISIELVYIPTSSIVSIELINIVLAATYIEQI